MGVEQKPKSLDELQTHFAELYGSRNTIYLPDRVSRINFFNLAVGDLHDAVRIADVPPKMMGILLARLPSRIFCLANGMNDTSVARAMAEKYPMDGCAYCHGNPCQCQEKRPNLKLEGIRAGEQLKWRLKDWQNHLSSLYGEKNKQRGTDNTLVRLFKEVCELMSFEYSLPRSAHTQIQLEREYSLELADCMAWSIAAADLLDHDLEKVTLERFWSNCWNCHQKPCICKNFDFANVSAYVKK